MEKELASLVTKALTAGRSTYFSSASGARSLAPQDAAMERGTQDFELQRLRILSCTAQAMLNSPGGLRFKVGTRPWLPGQAHEELTPVRRQRGYTPRWNATD